MIAAVDSARSESMWSLSCKHFWVTKDQHCWFPRALFCPFGSSRRCFDMKKAYFHTLETMCSKEKLSQFMSKVMFLLQLPLFDSHSVWLGCCIFWTHLVLCCLSVSAFTFVLPRNKGWCGCGLSRSRVGCCSLWAGEPGGWDHRQSGEVGRTCTL